MFQAVIPAVRAIGPVARATGRIVGNTVAYATMTYTTLIVGAIAVDGAILAAKGAKKAGKFAYKAIGWGRNGVYDQFQEAAGTGEFAN